MSLRRKSCDACFKGRRKCDRGYPTCSTCQRTKKNCHYAYSPIQVNLQGSPVFAEIDINTGTQHLASSGSPSALIEAATTDDPAIGPFIATSVASLDLEGDELGPLVRLGQPDSDVTSRRRSSFRNRHCTPMTDSSSCSTPSTLPVSSIPNFLGGLGEFQRMEGCTDSWQWVINELKRCPRDFATRGETLFLHKELYRNVLPPAIRAALGTSAMFCLLNENNHQILFRMVDAEVVELLQSPPSLVTDADGRDGIKDIIEELGRLQALTLYQMMRMFGGGIEQRAIVDLQRGLLTTRALQLLRRWQAEVGDSHRVSEDWNLWIVGESIRRTVIVIYMFYAVYSMAMYGFCVDFPTLAKLPVSMSPGSWQSEAAHMVQCSNETLPYEAFTQTWMVSPNRALHPFEKFLIVPCKGFEGIAAYSGRLQV